MVRANFLLPISRIALSQFIKQFALQRTDTLTRREYIITEANARDNVPKGAILTTKQHSATRIWCANINGLAYDNMGGKLTDIISIAKETAADMIAITEHNTDTIKYDIQSNLYDQCRKNLDTPQFIS